MKTPLIFSTLFASSILALGLTVSSTVSASPASGLTGQGTAAVTITAPDNDALSLVQVPDLDFGTHEISGTLNGLTQTTPVTSDLIVQDFRGLSSSATEAGYRVTAEVAGNATGFSGALGGNLTTSNVSVSLGNSSDGTLVGSPSLVDITSSNTIATGTAGQALGQQQTIGGQASMSITNVSGPGAVVADTYSATINYTLTAGI